VREADNLTTFMCRMSWKSGSLNLLELSGPHRGWYGTPLPFFFNFYLRESNSASLHDESSKDACLHRLLSSFVCRKDASEDIQCFSEQFMRYVVLIAVYDRVF